MYALYGYLIIGQKLYNDPKKFGTAFNLSPDDNSNEHTVEHITQKFIEVIGKGSYTINQSSNQVPGATYLRLGASKAKAMLDWKPKFLTEEIITFTADWYKIYVNNKRKIKLKTLEQVNYYVEKMDD